MGRAYSDDLRVRILQADAPLPKLFSKYPQTTPKPSLEHFYS